MFIRRFLQKLTFLSPSHYVSIYVSSLKLISSIIHRRDLLYCEKELTFNVLRSNARAHARKNVNALSPHCTPDDDARQDDERESKRVARKDAYERVRDMARGGRHCGPHFPFFSPLPDPQNILV